MPNWHVEFEVTHKYLADAQALLHSVKGISNVNIRPISERSPREGGNGKMDAVEKLINSRPNIKFDTAAIAQATNDSTKLAGQKLAYLAKAKRIKRVGPGRYMAVKSK